MLAFPVRREVGANVIEVMEGLRTVAREPRGAPAASRTWSCGVSTTKRSHRPVDRHGALEHHLRQRWCRGRCWRSCEAGGRRPCGALTIPVSIAGTFLIIVMLGRTLNVISLAGWRSRWATCGQRVRGAGEHFPAQADGQAESARPCWKAREVWGRVLAYADDRSGVRAGDLSFRKRPGSFSATSALGSGGRGLSMIVAVTVIPPLAARLLTREQGAPRFPTEDAPSGKSKSGGDVVLWFAGLIAAVAGRLNRMKLVRVLVIAGMTLGSLYCGC